MTIVFTPRETNIISTNLVRSVRFYRDVLEFIVGEREGPVAIHMHCADRPFLLLAGARSPPTKVAYCGAPAISFEFLVGDIEKVVNYLHDHGVQFEYPWRKEDSRVFTKGPDGLAIEIIQEAG